eukprot:GHVN01029051.1.p1 GENE.GHVN01029051.1~~GHVN01029051.1.p1  ORF type:complete len:232 (+),score=9.41 GHVN01029051.1:186-881(+)
MSVERCVVLILAEDRTSVFKWRVDAPKEIVCNQLVATARRLIATNGKPGSASTYEGEVDFVSVDDDTTRIPVETVIEGSVSRAKIRACQERPDGDTPSVTLSAFSKAEGLEKHFAKKLHISPPTASTTPAPNKPPSLARGTGGGTSLLNPDAARAVGPRYHANPVGHGSESGKGTKETHPRLCLKYFEFPVRHVLRNKSSWSIWLLRTLKEPQSDFLRMRSLCTQSQMIVG